MHRRIALALGALALTACTDRVPPLAPFTDLPVREVGHVPAPLQTPPAVSGGHLAVAASGRWAVAADPDRDRVWIFDLASERMSSNVPMQRGDEPGRLVEDSAGRFHVALRRGGAIASIDPSTGSLLARRAVCPAPRGIAHDASTDRLVVACAGGELVTLDSDPQGALLDSRVLEPDLRDVVIEDDHLYVSRFRAGQVLVVRDGAIAGRTQLAGPPGRTPAEGRVAWRMLADPRGGVRVLHQAHRMDRIDVESGGYGSDSGCGRSVVQPMLSHVDTEGQGAPLALGILTLAVDMTIEGSRATVISAAEEAALPAAEFELDGVEPCGFGDLVIAQDLQGPLTSIARTPAGTRLLLRRQPLSLVIERPQGTSAIVVERAADVTHPGHRLFHTTTGIGIACASCHPEGGEDGHTWIFGNDVRRTQDLRGGVLETGPFHWAGDMPTMTHIMNASLVERMADRPVSPALARYTEQWIDALVAIPTSATDEATLARGRAVFESADCGSCHAGARFTDNTNADVGMSEAVQVPSLRGVASRAPYFHLGCAPTLDEVVSGTCAPGREHDLSARDARERADLVAYLRSL